MLRYKDETNPRGDSWLNPEHISRVHIDAPHQARVELVTGAIVAIQGNESVDALRALMEPKRRGSSRKGTRVQEVSHATN